MNEANTSNAAEVVISYTVPPATPSIGTTQQPASATVGSSIADQATVTGLVSPSSADTVTFNLYSSATTQTSGTLLFSNTQTVSVSGSSATATSSGYTATRTGTDYWVATFNGDANNNSVSSGTAAEPVSITPASPSISTTQQPASATVGSSIADKATVSGGDSPSGTVTFVLYSNATASGTPLFTDANVALVSGVATSTGYTATATGTDYWVATYNGDTNNNGVSGAPSAEPVTVTPAVTVTPTALCLLTGQDVEGSAKFKALPSGQQRLIEALVTVACGPLNSISARLTPKQTAALIAAYDSAVNGLAATGWLTSGQASNLKTLAATL